MTGQQHRITTVSFPERLLAEIDLAAYEASITRNAFITRAVIAALRRGDVARYREVTLSPKSGSSVDDMFEWLFARRPTLADVTPRGGALPHDLRVVMMRVLTPTEMRRVEKVLIDGMSLEDLGKREGSSKQAVHACVNRAKAKLADSPAFLAALAAAFPDAGLTADILARARRQHAPKTRHTSTAAATRAACG